MTNVLIVEDSLVSRESFERQLAASGDFTVVAAIKNAANAVIACVKGDVDLVLMDVCTADNESGLVATATIKRRYPQVRVVVMTSMPEHSFLEKAREACADGFWYKELGTMSVVEVCERTMRGEHPWPERTPRLYIGLAASDDFTQRELDVMRALATGSRYEDIAEQLHLSTNTVKYHVKNILQKTGFRSTVQLVAEVVESRFVLPKY